MGSLPPPNHGQSIAFEAACSVIRECAECHIIETSFRQNSVLAVISYLFMVPYRIFVFKPDVVYFLCSRSLIGGLRDLYLLLFCKMAKFTVCNHLHGSDFDSYLNSRSKLYRKLIVYLFSRVDRHGVLIEGMQSQLKAVTSNSRCVVINNFYKKPHRAIQQRVIDRSKGLVVCYLSSVIFSKGIFDLIAAIKSLDPSLSVTLKVAGGFVSDEFMSEQLVQERFFREIEGQSNITYHGTLNPDEKYDFLSRSDVFALPSFYRSEAVPLSIIEAMSVGCCILTTNFRYLSTLVSEENGVLVNVCSPCEIASSLERLHYDRERLTRIAASNESLARAHYSEERYQKSIRSFIGMC